MSTLQRSRGKSWILAAAFAAAASGIAHADDSSMSRWTGDSYAFFNNLDYRPGGFNVARAAQPAKTDKTIVRHRASPPQVSGAVGVHDRRGNSSQCGDDGCS
ncbi:MAG TPA: hypothetical protein VMV45_02250 [Casimicrobiaceae bacterium]|nr:hypothetical protein [Casimicrobiaceae bacterium]